jgi:hypothetical protein
VGSGDAHSTYFRGDSHPCQLHFVYASHFTLWQWPNGA